MTKLTVEHYLIGFAACLLLAATSDKWAPSPIIKPAIVALALAAIVLMVLAMMKGSDS